MDIGEWGVVGFSLGLEGLGVFGCGFRVYGLVWVLRVWGFRV